MSDICTYSKPLYIIFGGLREEGSHGIVSGNYEASEVGQELACEVEEDEEQVQGRRADSDIRLGEPGGPLQVDDGRVLGQL